MREVAFHYCRVCEKPLLGDIYIVKLQHIPQHKAQYYLCKYHATIDEVIKLLQSKGLAGISVVLYKTNFPEQIKKEISNLTDSISDFVFSSKTVEGKVKEVFISLKNIYKKIIQR